ncbi:Hypothetical predicted protein [Paramuricea clavata]|nr:Hypothetical predicted protein [Paramuricea clavata]
MTIFSIISENAEKKSDLTKKTSVSINGQFLPMAQLSASDKNIHVTVQKANPPGQQLQPTIQEVSLQGQNTGNQNVGNGAVQIPVVQTSGPQVGLHPGIQTSNNLGTGGVQNTNTIGMSPGIITNGNQVVGMSPGITNNGNQAVGMSPGITNNGNQAVGMSPGITTNGNQVLGMSPGITTNGNQVLGMSPGITTTGNQVVGMSPGIQGNNVPPHGELRLCGTNNLIQGQNNPNAAGQNINTQSNRDQVLLVKNPDGQLSYKPVAC